MNKSRTSNRKPRKSKPSKAQSSASSGAKDECHSTNSPACSLAKQVTVDVLPEAAEALKLMNQQQNGRSPEAAAVSSAPTMLGRLLRQHLLAEYKLSRIDPSAPAMPPTSKKKRKKKKKKGKGAGAEGEAASTTSTTEVKGTVDAPTSGSDTRKNARSQPTPTLQRPLETTATTTAAKASTTALDMSTSPRRLSPARTHVLHWMEKIVGDMAVGGVRTSAPIPPNRTLDAFLSFLAATPLTPPTIDLQEVMFHIKDMVCTPCRTAVEAYWSGTGIPPNELGIISGSDNQADRPYALYPALLVPPQSICKTTIPTLGGGPEWGNADTDRAFDYRAMEEGQMEHGGGGQVGVPLDAFCLYSVIDRETTKPIALEMRNGGHANGNRTTSSSVAPAMDMAGIERLVRDMILPCGLPEVEAPNARILSDDEFQSIVARVNSKEEPILQQLQHLQQQKDQQVGVVRGLVANIGPTTPTVPFDVKASSDLFDSDKGCDQLLDGVLTLLLQLTGIFQGLRGVGAAATNGDDTAAGGDWALRTMQALWRSYSECVESLLESLLAHEGKLLQLASRPGVVPQMFLNVSHRSSYTELVQRKLDAIAELCTNVLVILTDDMEEHDTMSSDTTTFLRKLLTREAFVAVALPCKNNGSNNTASKLDETCRTLLRSYNELTEPVRKCQNINHVLDTQEQRCLSLATQLATVNELIVEEFRSTLEERLPSLDTTLWNDLRREYRRVSSEKYEPPEPDEWDDGFNSSGGGEDRSSKAGSLAADRKRLAKLTSIAASQWLCMRSMQASPHPDGPNSTIPEMPLRLKKWMSADEDKEPDSNNKKVCQGSQPQRRLACILSCLLYKWLQERCEEWHSELTQKELLDSEEGAVTFPSSSGGTAMENTTSTTSDIPNRSSKSSRRKRKKKAAAAAAAEKSSQEAAGNRPDHTKKAAMPEEQARSQKKQQNGAKNGEVDGFNNKQRADGSDAGGWVTVGDGGKSKNGKKTATTAAPSVAGNKGADNMTSASPAAEEHTTKASKLGERRKRGKQEADKVIEARKGEELSDESGVGVEETKEEPPEEPDRPVMTKAPGVQTAEKFMKTTSGTESSTTAPTEAKQSSAMQPLTEKRKEVSRSPPEAKESSPTKQSSAMQPLTEKRKEVSRSPSEAKESSPTYSAVKEKKEDSRARKAEPAVGNSTSRHGPKNVADKQTKATTYAKTPEKVEKSRLTVGTSDAKDGPKKGVDKRSKAEPTKEETHNVTLRTRKGGKVSAEDFLVRRFREVSKAKGVVFL